MARRRSADAYSRLVATLKIGLPLAGLSLLAAVILLSLRPERPGGLTFSAADLEAMGAGLKVTNPRFSGTSLDGDRYDFEAAVVVPASAKLEMAEIDRISGSIRFADGLRVDLDAARASVDLVSETLLFDEGLRIETSSGLSADVGRAHLDLRAGVLNAEGGVVAESELGTVTSERMTIAAEEPGGIEAFTEESSLGFAGDVELRYEPPRND